jgi:hypothetical protein
MARKENLSQSKDLPLSIPSEADDYLNLLATLGKLGRSRTEIATHILVRELHSLERDGYHERRIPKPLPKTAE